MSTYSTVTSALCAASVLTHVGHPKASHQRHGRADGKPERTGQSHTRPRHPDEQNAQSVRQYRNGHQNSRKTRSRNSQMVDEEAATTQPKPLNYTKRK